MTDGPSRSGRLTGLWRAITRSAPPAPPALAAVLHAWPDATHDGERVERTRDGVVATWSPGEMLVVTGARPPYDLAPPPAADAPPIVRGDRVAGWLALTDPDRAAITRALDADASLYHGRWQAIVDDHDPPALAALGECLLDAAAATACPVPPPGDAPIDRPPADRLRLLVLCHLDGHPDTGPVRSRACRDPDPAVRALAHALARHGILPALIRPPVPADLRAEVIARLSGPARGSALAGVLTDADPTAAVALVPHLAAEGVAALAPALAAPHPAVRRAALEALLRADGGDIIGPATDAIADPHPAVVRAAAIVLAHCGGEPAVRAMRARAVARATPPDLAAHLDRASAVIIRRYDAIGQGAAAREALGWSPDDA